MATYQKTRKKRRTVLNEKLNRKQTDQRILTVNITTIITTALVKVKLVPWTLRNGQIYRPY